jgi:hypothetical protein
MTPRNSDRGRTKGILGKYGGANGTGTKLKEHHVTAPGLFDPGLCHRDPHTGNRPQQRKRLHPTYRHT